jgi:hypothetical protein
MAGGQTYLLAQLDQGQPLAIAQNLETSAEVVHSIFLDVWVRRAATARDRR